MTSLDKTPLRFRWSREHWLHRTLVPIAYRLLAWVPLGLKYSLGAIWRRRSMPYQLVKPDWVVLQVGAPSDTLSGGRSRALLFAWMTRGGGTTIAVEPDPTSAAALQAAADRLGFAHLKVQSGGLWSEPGSMTLYRDPNHPASNFTDGTRSYSSARLADYETVEVPVFAGDQLLQALGVERPDLISITTNGAEHAILAGLEQTLNSGVRWVSLAWTGTEIQQAMESRGYQLVAHDDRGFTFERLASASTRERADPAS